MSEGDVQPPQMVVGEAHNIGEGLLLLQKLAELTNGVRYVPCA